MNYGDLLIRLNAEGIRLRIVDEKIRVSSPAGGLDPELRQALLANKEEIKSLLQQESTIEEYPLVRQDRPKRLPLSYGQQRLWFLDRLEGTSREYNIVEALQLTGMLDIEALGKAINTIVERHEVLRTRFEDIEGEPAQVIEALLRITITREDWSGLDLEHKQQRVVEAVQREGEEAFDLERGPLLRIKVLKLNEQDHILLRTTHHIISDAWSEGVFNRELMVLYEAYREGRDNPLQPLVIQYADFTLWQRRRTEQGALEEGLKYWKKQLAVIPEGLELPADRKYPATEKLAGDGYRITLSRELTAKLKQLSREAQGTIYMTLLAAFAVLLAKYSGQYDIVVGSPIANRPETQLEELIGFFVNTLVLRISISHSQSFRALLEEVKRTSLQAYQHQDVPFEQLVAELSPERRLDRTPLFQVTFAMENAPWTSQQLFGLTAKEIEIANTFARYDLSLHALEQADEIELFWLYRRGLFERWRIKQMAAHYERILAAIADRPEKTIDQIDLLTDEERDTLLHKWTENGGYPLTQCLHELFADQAARNPDAPAIYHQEQSLTYRQLNEAANRLAGYLRKQAIGREKIVAICLERGSSFITSVLAVWKAGAAYVPLDSAFPRARILEILGQINPEALITSRDIQQQLDLDRPKMLVLDELTDQLSVESSNNYESLASLDNLAYVMFTSGSSGRPKGVAVQHRSATNFYHALLLRIYAGTGGRLRRASLNASMVFDASIKQLCLLFSGAQLFIVPESTRYDGAELLSFIKRHRLDVVDLTPSQLDLIIHEGLLDAKEVDTAFLVGGEDIGYLWKVLKSAPTCEFYNHYGPTECTVNTTVCRIRDCDDVPGLGYPISNAQAFLLDEKCDPVPVGIPGELYIAGEGVARGYVNSPGLTAERFVANPFGEPGSRMYRTGDLARRRPNGGLEFLGRNDRQIKLRGFRIEPGEIEAVLRRQAGVRDAVVTLREDRPGEKCLVGYVAPGKGTQIDPDQTRSALLRAVPGYMVPAVIVVVQELPLTRQGKVDVGALPQPIFPTSAAIQGPVGPQEEIVCGIFADVLGLVDVGVDDSFFDLGGHSLLATRLVNRIRSALGAELGIRTLFEAPTVRGIIDRIKESGGGTRPLEPQKRPEHIPVSHAQLRMWFLERLGEGHGTDQNIQEVFRLKGNLNPDILQQSINEIAARHETLRTCFPDAGGIPEQRIETAVQLDLPVEDLSDLHSADQEAAIILSLNRECATPFDLCRGPLLRLRLLKLSPREHVLVQTMHHIIWDGWSQVVFIRECFLLYSALCDGSEIPLPSLDVQYADFALWQRAWFADGALKEGLAYWKEQLAGIPQQLDLPTDRGRSTLPSRSADQHYSMLSHDPLQTLKSLCRECGCTLYMGVLSVFALLLQRYTGQTDIVVGCPIANRQEEKLERLIGCFVNILAIRIRVNQQDTFRDLLKHVRDTALKAYEYQYVPFEQVVETLAPDRDLRTTPIFQVGFSLDNVPVYGPPPSGLEVETVSLGKPRVYCDLQLHAREEIDRLDLCWVHDGELFDLWRLEQIAEHLCSLLGSALRAPDDPLYRLNLLTESEQMTVLERFQATSASVPTGTFLDLFEFHADRFSSAIAVIHKEEALSYQELNARANSVAHHLVEIGIGPEMLVAVALPRSLSMVIALLGIMKSGAAYLPLDSSLPELRLFEILKDAEPKLLLSNAAFNRPISQKLNLKSLDLQQVQFASSVSRRNLTNDERILPLDMDHPVYVLYTSGSTGMPKGVIITHSGVVNLAQQQIEGFSISPEARVLQYASFSFDASFSEIITALGSGATLVLLDREEQVGEPLAEVIQRHEITHATLPPAVLPTIAPVQEDLGCLGTLVVAGESCPPELVEAWSRRRTMLNAYGPTETTVCATISAPLSGRGRPPIGSPIQNTRLYVLDENLEPTPVGTTGELYIAGPGLARGYLDRSALTATTFVANPFHAEGGGRMYRTGDLVRWKPDKSLEFVGRSDQQIKIHGFRVELGEIEEALKQHQSVTNAVVTLRESREGHNELVAYVVEAKPKFQQSDDIELWPSVEGYSVFDDLLYYAMVEDKPRIAAYQRAIDSTVSGKIVLDLGTGPEAVLAEACVRSGARKVYAVEVDPQACESAARRLKDRGLLDHVILLQGDSTEIEIPEPVDVCVSSIVGAIGSSQGAISVLNDARRFLSADGIMIPERSVTWIAAVRLPDSVRSDLRFHDLGDHYARAIFRKVGHVFDLRLGIRNMPRDLVVSTQAPVECLEFAKVMHESDSAAAELMMAGPGPIDGFLLWVSLWTSKEHVFDILSQRCALTPVFVPAFYPGRNIAAGDRIHVILSRKPCSENLRYMDYELAGSIFHTDGRSETFRHWLPHFPKSYQASEFYKQLFRQDGNTAAPEKHKPLEVALREWLSLRLPHYMVPSHFVPLSEIPLTSSGKIDRFRLPAAAVTRPGTVRPAGTIKEKILCALLADLLMVDQVGLDDSFFSLGGDSILSIQLVSRARKRGLLLAPRDIFDNQTVESLASASQFISVGAAGEREDRAIGVIAPTPIMHCLFQSEIPISEFSQSLVLGCPASLNRGLLERALEFIIARHHALRMKVTRNEEDRNYSVEIGPQNALDAAMLISRIDVAEVDDSVLWRAMIEEEQAARKRLSPAAGIMMQAVWFDAGPLRAGRLLMVVNHLAVDAVSWRILLEDFGDIWRSMSKGDIPRLEPPGTSFRCWTEILVSEALSPARIAELPYWVGVLSGGDGLCKLGNENDSSVLAWRAPFRSAFSVKGLLTKSAIARFQAGMEEILLTALVLAVLHWRIESGNPGETELLVDLERHGREQIVNDIDLSRTIGWFTSFFPVRLDLASINIEDAIVDGAALEAALNKVKQQLREVPGKGLGYGLLRYQNPETALVLERLTRPAIGFNYLGRFSAGDQSGWVVDKDSPQDTDEAVGLLPHLIDLNVTILETPEESRIVTDWRWLGNTIEAHDVSKLAETWGQLVQRLLAPALKPIGIGGASSDLSGGDRTHEDLSRLATAHPLAAEVWPALPLQKEMVLCALQPGAPSDLNVVQVILRIEGALVPDRLALSMREVLRRNRNLLAGFEYRAPNLLVFVTDDARIPWRKVDLSSCDPDERAKRLSSLIDSDRASGFDFKTPPLLRVTLIDLGPALYNLVLTVHHVLLDGWSMPLFIGELFARYAENGGAPTRSLQAPYGAYIRWLKERDHEDHIGPWCNLLSNLKQGTIISKPSGQRLASIERVFFALPSEVTQGLAFQARTNQVTLSTILHAAWAIVLGNLSRQNDVVFGQIVAGRAAPIEDIENLIGFCMNVLPIRVQLDPDEPFVALVKDLQLKHAFMLEHQHVDIRRIEREIGVGDLFDTVVIYQNYPKKLDPFQPSDINVEYVSAREKRHYRLALSVAQHDGMDMSIEYQTSCFEEQFVLQMAAQLQSVLRAVAFHPGSTTSSLMREIAKR